MKQPKIDWDRHLDRALNAMSARRLFLLLLAVLCFWTLTKGVSPWSIIPVFLVVYLADEIGALLRDWRVRDRPHEATEAVRNQLRELQRKWGHDIEKDQGTLPLESDRTSSTEVDKP